MSKECAREKVAQVCNSANGWDTAICDAEAMIQESEARIQRLRRAIKTFRALRDRGEPFFGEGHKQVEVSDR
jgi:hypothetical protein